MVGCIVLVCVSSFLARDEREGIFVVVLMERFDEIVDDDVVSCWSVLLAFFHILRTMSMNVVRVIDYIVCVPRSEIMCSSPGVSIIPLFL